MTVYLEYAFAENFILDGLLLTLALKCARTKRRPLRIALAAAIGGAEALLFPLLRLPVWAAYAMKISGGALIALISVPKSGKRACAAVVLLFFLLTFLLGGILTAIYSFFDVPYVEGTGYLVEGAPAALVLGGAGLFALAAGKLCARFFRRRALHRALFDCRVSANGRSFSWRGLCDSGNLLRFRGEPVCVIPPVAALALFRGGEPVGRMILSTVSGSTTSPVFAAERLKVGPREFGPVYFTVGEVRSEDYTIILHTAFTEGSDEDPVLTQKVAETVRGK